MNSKSTLQGASAELVTAAIARDRPACNALVELLYPLVVKIVRTYAKRYGNEEDWAQEVFLRFFTRLPQFRGESPLEHWTARLAVNVCLDQLRKRAVRRELRWADLGESEATLVRDGFTKAPSVDESFAARDLADRLLETLGPEDQIIL
jgi:RNA polymerase sigma factor (sigma-70 family)